MFPSNIRIFAMYNARHGSQLDSTGAGNTGLHWIPRIIMTSTKKRSQSELEVHFCISWLQYLSVSHLVYILREKQIRHSSSPQNFSLDSPVFHGIFSSSILHVFNCQLLKTLKTIYTHTLTAVTVNHFLPKGRATDLSNPL